MLKIGSGAGFSMDRLEPAVELAEKVDLDYLILECLAERTIAIAQKEKKQDSTKGFDPLLEERMHALLPILREKRFRIISNIGAANPLGAGKKIIDIAKSLNITIKVAVVLGDDVLQELDNESRLMESEKTVEEYQPIISANAYLGVEALLPALKTGADIIVTGRVADPSLFLAPMIHYYDWPLDDYDKLGQGTLIGHLLECAGQITGGYYADIGKKEVPNLENIGFPYAIVDRNGETIITKANDTGGVVNLGTVKEQLLYEVHDPSYYLTPDVTADFSNVRLSEVDTNMIKVTGGRGRKKPATYKVSIGYHAGYLSEGEISYAGSTAVERGELAKEILTHRLKNKVDNFRIDLIGMSSLNRTSFKNVKPYEIRVRAAALCQDEKTAKIIGNEVEALYTNGPYGGGGVRKHISECIGVVSTLMSRKLVDRKIQVEVLSNE